GPVRVAAGAEPERLLDPTDQRRDRGSDQRLRAGNATQNIRYRQGGTGTVELPQADVADPLAGNVLDPEEDAVGRRQYLGGQPATGGGAAGETRRVPARQFVEEGGRPRVLPADRLQQAQGAAFLGDGDGAGRSFLEPAKES